MCLKKLREDALSSYSLKEEENHGRSNLQQSFIGPPVRQH